MVKIAQCLKNSKLTTVMSQRLVSSSNSSHKRKYDEIQENNSKDDTEETRRAIIELSKIKPALSPNIGLSWFKALETEFSKPYFEKLGKFLEHERTLRIIFPPKKDVFAWTNAVNAEKVKIVILGQDPYHGPNQAHGFAFSVPKGVRIPPSLINIFKELENDVKGFQKPSHGDLYGWAIQGVLLLNTCLTVQANQPNSHQNRGWEDFTNAVISWISNHLKNVVFMLWGRNAKLKSSLISKDKHLIIEAAHPSPLSAHNGFFGCRHFSKANDYLKKFSHNPIDWSYLPKYYKV